MKNINISVILAIAAVLALPGCTVDEPGMEPGTFEIDESLLSYAFEQGQETVFIPVKTNIPAYEWVCTSNKEWCKLAANYGNEVGLILAVPANEYPEPRSASATVNAGAATYTFSVQQLGYGPAILVSDQTVSAVGGEVRINVVANIEYDIAEPELDAVDIEEGKEAWFQRKEDTQATKTFATEPLSYSAQPNTMPYSRVAKITFTPKLDEYKEKATTVCTVTQSTINITPNETATQTSKQVKARDVTATDPYSDTYLAKYMIDGLWATSYQSPWAANKWPVTIEFTFNPGAEIDYIEVTNARSIDYQGEDVAAADKKEGHGNGRPGLCKIYSRASEGAEYTLVCEYDFEKTGGYKIPVYFPTTVESPQAIKLEFEDGSNGQISLAEVTFWTSTRTEMNEVIKEIFTDMSCSELKEGVTREQINNLFTYSPFLAQYSAAAMLQGSYPESEREFRVASYKAYSDSKVNQEAVTRIYTSMDNPTGIHVNEGDEVMICVDEIPANQEVAIATYGDTSSGYEPNYGGGDAKSESYDQKQVLMEGVNVYNATADGMLYVLNTARPLNTDSQPVKVHILPSCGTVQGYFDIEKDRDVEGRFSRLISACTYKYFMLKGKKIMFNLHTSELRNYTQAQIVSGIEAWDNIVTWQHDLMGIDEMSWYNNHMMAISTTQSSAYMDAANRRVRFATNTLYRIIDGEELLSSEDNAWGPAHELGHCNQFAINWRGASESSNNLFSNYAHYMFKKYSSRGSKLEKLALSWAKKENFEISGEEGSSRSEDTNLHMRMNWQLWTYFHLAGKQDDFWPTLFGLLRTNRIPNGELDQDEDIGKGMMIYVEQACDAAKMDLTEFFETWGFFWPINMNISQYGTSKCTINNNMVSALKARIAEKNYPKAPPIQYIEDRNVVGNERYCDYGYYEIFRDNLKITGTPAYTVTGRQYRMSGCTNAAAIELRRPATEEGALGTLVYFSNMSGFTVPDAVTDADLQGVKVYAVQADGTRIEAKAN